VVVVVDVVVVVVASGSQLPVSREQTAFGTNAP
jgi:hypothetical protein